MAVFTEEQWTNIWKQAGAIKTVAGEAPPTTSPIPGRFVSVLVDKVAKFWAKHRDTLAPFLTQVAIAALEALLVAQPDIDAINRRGPG